MQVLVLRHQRKSEASTRMLLLLVVIIDWLVDYWVNHVKLFTLICYFKFCIQHHDCLNTMLTKFATLKPITDFAFDIYFISKTRHVHLLSVLILNEEQTPLAPCSRLRSFRHSWIDMKTEIQTLEKLDHNRYSEIKQNHKLTSAFRKRSIVAAVEEFLPFLQLFPWFSPPCLLVRCQFQSSWQIK